MFRLCTDVETFVCNHGVDAYQEEFRPTMNIDELLDDKLISRSNDIYENTSGPGITEDHICKYIEHWGIEKYIEWCARDSTYSQIIENEAYALAQRKFVEKIVEGDVVFGIRGYTLGREPFRRELRNHKGVAVPEPPTNPRISEPFDVTFSLYIQKNGIINYMLKVTSEKSLVQLLDYQDVAEWQKSYIRKLEYDNHLL